MEEGTHPILIGGAVAGKLTVTRQGARTVFDAWCRPMEGIHRISVYGGGREGCLGVLTPEGDGMTLHRCLSRTQLLGFPAEIERVGLAGETVTAEEEKSPCPAEPVQEQEQEQEPVQEQKQEREPVQEPEPVEAAEQAPPDEEALNWYASPDGALVCFDGSHSLIALPEGDPRIPEGYEGKQKTVEGKSYLVYITKNGRIVS